MAGTFYIEVQEARGYVAVPADLFRLAVVMGCSSAGSGMSSFFLSATSAIADRGYGDAVDTLTQIIEQRQPNASSVKFPAAMFTIAGDTPGSYGTIDNTGVTGTVVPAVDATTEPFGTYEAAIRIVDDGNNGAGAQPGTAGILYQWSLDNGRHWSNTTALGTSYSIAIPNSATGFYLEAPSAQLTSLIAFAVEARTDTLAHLADVTAHDAADTSSAQVALAASSAPATAAQAWAVLNLCRAALLAHDDNITAHNGPDPVNVVSAAVATNTQSGIALAIDYRTKFNAHLGIALAAAAAGLKAATATSASPVTLTSTDLLDAGEALLAVYPRRLTFATAGSTPSDAPATVDITGTDYLDAVQTETLALAQTATTVTSVKAYKTITSLAYAAGDGTGATIAIGYGQGVHNSADVTNTIAAAAPSHGTLATDDTWVVRTFAPAPSTGDVATAFTTLAGEGIDHALVVLDFPCDATMAGIVTTGLNALKNVGKRVTALVRTRLPDFEDDETEAAWLASVAADYDSFTDSRILVRAGYGLVTDAVTTRQYLRSTLQQLAADVVRTDISTWPCAPADRPEPNVTLADSSGATVGHDEGARGAATGLSNDELGNRFSCEQRLDNYQQREAVYNTVPWVMFAADEGIRHLMARRIANEIERDAASAAIPTLGGKYGFIPANPDVLGSQPVLTEASRNAIHAVIHGRLTGKYAQHIQNADDADVETGLVQVNPVVVVSGGTLIAVTVTVAALLFGYLVKMTITYAPKAA